MAKGDLSYIKSLFRGPRARKARELAVEKFIPRWFREIKYSEARFEQHKENRERQSKLLIGLQLDTDLSGNELKDQRDEKINDIVALLRDETLRLDRRKLDGSLDMAFRCTMAQLIEDCYFGPYGKGGRPSNKERGKPLKNEIGIGRRNQELEVSGIKTKTERIAILSEEFECSLTHVKKCLKAYEKGMQETDIGASIDRQFYGLDADDGEVLGE